MTVVTPTLTALTTRCIRRGNGHHCRTFALVSDTGSNIKIIGTTGSLSITAGDGAMLELDGFAARDVNVTLQNGVTGKINASGTVTGRASDGVLMSVTDGGTIIR